MALLYYKSRISLFRANFGTQNKVQALIYIRKKKIGVKRHGIKNKKKKNHI